MKRLWYVVFCVFGICIVNNGYSQKIEDYFCPLNIKFESRPSEKVNKVNTMRINSAFIENSELYFEDKILRFSDYGLMEIYHNLENITITKDRIISKGGKVRSLKGSYRPTPKNTLLIIPRPNKPVSWKYYMNYMGGYYVTRTAKLVTLNVPTAKGMKAINAIEVTINGKPVEYWAKGYGLIMNFNYVRVGFENYTVSKYYDVEKKEREDRERREREEREAKEKREREERIRKERADSLLLKRIYEGEIFSNNEIKDKPKLTIDFSKLSNRWRKIGTLDRANQSYSLIKNRSLTIDILKNGAITNVKTEDPTSSEKLSDILTGVTCISSGKIMVRGKAHNIDFRERLGYQQCFCRKDEKNYDIILLLKKSKKGLIFERKKVKYTINSDDMTYILNHLKTDKTIETLPNGKYNLIVKTNWVFRIKLEDINPDIGAGFLEKRFYSISCKTKKENINIDID